MLKKFITERYFCGLDIGTQSIKASIVERMDDSKASIVGVYETPTRGYYKASITDLDELSECIHKTLAALSKKTGIKIKDLVLGIGGELVQIRPSQAVIALIDRGNKIITRQDIIKVQTQARLLGSNMDEIVVHNFPQYYKVDDVNMASNPLGLYGRKLEMSCLLILVQGTAIKNLTTAVNQAGYDVAHLFFASYASSQINLSAQERKQGSILVDVGSSLTNILMYKDDQVRSIFQIKMGGDGITQAIVQDINITFDLAEEIKKSYAAAIGTDKQNDEEILIRKDDNYIPVQKKLIHQSIEPLINDFASSIVKAINESPFYDQMNSGIVMSGGGALLQGLPEHIEQITNLPVRMGQVKFSKRRLHNTATFSSAVGLAQLGLDISGGVKFQHPKREQKMHQWINKIKELYQEYF